MKNVKIKEKWKEEGERKCECEKKERQREKAEFFNLKKIMTCGMLLLAHHYSIISHLNVFHIHNIVASIGNPFLCHKITPFHYQKEVTFGHWVWAFN